ncbi:MAG: toast rack family protein [Anaerolineae bacterium]|jgi:hypothetical protein|nr:toast rack family protein [Anaerolineae bacterium]
MAAKPVLILLIATVGLAVLLGCTISGSAPDLVAVGESVTETVTVEPDGAETARITLRMGAGELTVDGGADTLLEGSFTYNVADWKPEVRYSVSDGEGSLTVRQPNTDQISLRSGTHNAWDLRLSDAMPMRLRLECGAGEQDVDLVGLDIAELDITLGAGDSRINVGDNPNLSRLDLSIGAGSVELDLGGGWTGDAEIDLQGGVGETTLRLPNDVGVRVEVTRGIGDVDTSGLYREGNAWVNEAYETSEVTLTVRVRAGIGRVVLDVQR